MKAAEMVALLSFGVKVTINSDDPAYFGAYVADNYLALAEKAGLQADELVQLAKNSFEAAWLPDTQKQAYLTSIDEYVAGYPTA
jgi:adenosine deaminase